MKDEKSSSFKNLFKSDDDDRSYRFFLKKRDTTSSSSSLENSSSIGSEDKKSSHVSLRRFFNKLKPDEPKEKKKHHFLPSHPGSELYRKYTKGKLLGTGASGSVNLVHLKTDPTKVYAVKKFRAKLHNETEADYKIKVSNEFKVGEILVHENLIKTAELIKDNHGVFGSPDYYIIMEYCKYDFFNLVMSGLMDINETNCYFSQIINGVSYLHSMGLAHRDLKLDNCVVNDKGILKLIDFGSAVQFRKQYTPDTDPQDVLMVGDRQYKLVLSTGIVGSDPYLSPEVFTQIEPQGQTGYDARKVDVWSIAIIYCCMVLRRFPWKLPKTSDPSYKLYLHDERKLFKLLPENSVDLIRHMLKPKDDRYLIEDVLNHEYVKSIDFCTTEQAVTDHEHHLVTEEQLEQINNEREMVKKLKQTGMA